MTCSVSIGNAVENVMARYSVTIEGTEQGGYTARSRGALIASGESMSFYLARKGIRKAPGTVIKAVPLPEPKMVQGFGACGQAGAICEQAGFSHALVVTDKTLHRLGLHEKVVASLEAHGIAHTLFCDIDSEPTEQIVDVGRAVAVECGADCIVALGGGSVLDSSKVMDLLRLCGLERECTALREEDYDHLVGMINADSINYSPPRTFTDREIRTLLDQIRRGR